MGCGRVVFNVCHIVLFLLSQLNVKMVIKIDHLSEISRQVLHCACVNSVI